MSSDALSSSQRKYLRGLGHSLDPIIHIGRAGLSESVLASLDQALGQHELIKIRFLDHRGKKRELCADIEEKLRAEVAGIVGHVAILYRQARDPEKRRLRLPKSPN